MNRITDPTLLLDEQKARDNIRRMAQKARQKGLELKPHFKTHQSLTVGRWFKDEGIKKITVSSVEMAEYFAGDGWSDITIAFPLNPRTLGRVQALAENIELSLIISDPEIIPILAQGISTDIGLYIEVDTGSGRTGFQPVREDVIRQIINSITRHHHLRFLGFYSHPGHSYRARSASQILEIQHRAVQQMNKLKTLFGDRWGPLRCCIGDTPSCSAGEKWDGIDEISPGNFVFYDLMQVKIGACQPENIAVALACPVVAIYPDRSEIAVHGGAIHLSKDYLKYGDDPVYGRLVSLSKDNRWESSIKDCYVRSVSQEHGIIRCSDKVIRELKLGNLVGILPVHSCLAADTMRQYVLCQSMAYVTHMRGPKP